MNWPEKWNGKIWATSDGCFDERDLQRVLLAIRDGLGLYGICKVLGAGGLTDRRAARGLQLLRREGLIFYRYSECSRWEWTVTDEGREVAASLGAKGGVV